VTNLLESHGAVFRGVEDVPVGHVDVLLRAAVHQAVTTPPRRARLKRMAVDTPEHEHAGRGFERAQRRRRE
jgi:hypothetical protein